MLCNIAENELYNGNFTNSVIDNRGVHSDEISKSGTIPSILVRYAWVRWSL